jgi:hypothetical protein
MVTRSASHFPCQCTCFSPMAASFSKTTVRSFRDVEAPRPRVMGGSRPGVLGPASKLAAEGSWGVAPVAVPGCLKMPAKSVSLYLLQLFAQAPDEPKLIDFLCGCTLHEIVCPEETFTQRTRYDLLWTSMFSIPAMVCVYSSYPLDARWVRLGLGTRGRCGDAREL